jgi:hypothetical protein
VNKHLYLRLLRRGSIRTIKELEARDRIIERVGPCYSTEERRSAFKDGEKNKGCIAASTAIRTRNAFDESCMRSGRTRFHTGVGEKVFSFQEFNMRVLRQSRAKR